MNTIGKLTIGLASMVAAGCATMPYQEQKYDLTEVEAQPAQEQNDTITDLIEAYPDQEQKENVADLIKAYSAQRQDDTLAEIEALKPESGYKPAKTDFKNFTSLNPLYTGLALLALVGFLDCLSNYCSPQKLKE